MLPHGTHSMAICTGLDVTMSAVLPGFSRCACQATEPAKYLAGCSASRAIVGPASQQRRTVADQLRVPKLAAFMNDADADVLAFTTLPKKHRAKIHSAEPLERLNGEIKRHTDVVSIFPHDAAIVRVVSFILLEQNDE
jgi:hypothetical protein